jgi:glycosyltransferase involved in cell wall biosynthesis
VAHEPNAARAIRPLYISPTGRGGVDFGIQNILRAVRRAGLPGAELLRLREMYNFAPFLIQRGLPARWYEGFDIVQGRSRVAFALRAPGRPLVTTVHHLTTDPELQPYSSLQQRIFYRLVESRYDGWSIRDADAVVCVSRYTQRHVEATYGRRDTVLIYDGMDTEVFVPPPGMARRDDGLPPRPERIRLLFIGNRTRRKGFDLLPKIMDLLPDDYVLYYNGGFQDTGALPTHPRMVNIGTPDRAGLVAAYQSCDIMLFPSRLEGFGIAPAEAMLCGRPVVTTNISALPEVVDDGENGFLCPRNDVAAYASAVRALGEDATLRRRFGEHGREKIVRSFGYDQLGEGFAALYRKLLG